MVPHFREALDLRQGCVVFHRSGDKDIGYHGNSEIHCPEPGSLQISVVPDGAQDERRGGLRGGGGRGRRKREA